MINDQEYITTELKKTLEKMIILSTPRLNNLIAMIIGIICSQSVVLSKISQELKDCYSSGTEESKIKRLQRFLILQFSLKVGKRAVPLWFKLFKYKQDSNKDFIHVKEGLRFLHKILTDYIKRNIDLTYAKVKDDYDWRFNVVTNNQRQMYILSWSSDRNDKNWTLQNLYANNFKELVKKIKQMENEIITYINKDHVCPYCNGTGCKTEKFDTNKWFSEVNK